MVRLVSLAELCASVVRIAFARSLVCACVALILLAISTFSTSCDLLLKRYIGPAPASAEIVKAAHDANLWLFEDCGAAARGKKFDDRQGSGQGRSGGSDLWIGMTFHPASSDALLGGSADGFGDLGEKKGKRVLQAKGKFRCSTGNGPTKGNSWLGCRFGTATRTVMTFDAESMRILGEKCYYKPDTPSGAEEQLEAEISYSYCEGVDAAKLKHIKYASIDAKTGKYGMVYEIDVLHKGNKVFVDKSVYYRDGKQSSVFTLEKAMK